MQDHTTHNCWWASTYINDAVKPRDLPQVSERCQTKPIPESACCSWIRDWQRSSNASPVASKYYMLAMGKRTHAHTIPMISLAVGRPRPVSIHPLLTAPSSLGFSNEAVKVRGEARCLSRLKRTFMTTLDCPTPAHHTKAPLFIRCRLLCTHTCESAAWKFILFVHQKHSPSVCTLKRVLWLFIKWLPCGHISEFTMR